MDTMMSQRDRHLTEILDAIEGSADALREGAGIGELLIFIDLCQRAAAYPDPVLVAAGADEVIAGLSGELPRLRARACALLADDSSLGERLLQRGVALVDTPDAPDTAEAWGADLLMLAGIHDDLEDRQQADIDLLLRDAVDLMELHPEPFAPLVELARHRAACEPTEHAPPAVRRLIEQLTSLCLLHDSRPPDAGAGAAARVAGLLAGARARSGASEAQWAALVARADAAIAGYQPALAPVISLPIPRSAPPAPLALAADSDDPRAKIPMPGPGWTERVLPSGLYVGWIEQTGPDGSRFYIRLTVDDPDQIDLTGDDVVVSSEQQGGLREIHRERDLRVLLTDGAARVRVSASALGEEVLLCFGEEA
jgi:hypothetical protein